KGASLFPLCADDFNIYVSLKRYCLQVTKSITEFIKVGIKLKVNEQKSAVDRPWKRKFLGFPFTLIRNIRLFKFLERVINVLNNVFESNLWRYGVKNWDIKPISSWLVS